jgi:hypothetical protein
LYSRWEGRCTKQRLQPWLCSTAPQASSKARKARAGRSRDRPGTACGPLALHHQAPLPVLVEQLGTALSSRTAFFLLFPLPVCPRCHLQVFFRPQRKRNGATGKICCR